MAWWFGGWGGFVCSGLMVWVDFRLILCGVSFCLGFCVIVVLLAACGVWFAVGLV